MRRRVEASCAPSLRGRGLLCCSAGRAEGRVSCMLVESCFAGEDPNEDCEWAGRLFSSQRTAHHACILWAAPSSSRLVEVVWAARDKELVLLLMTGKLLNRKCRGGGQTCDMLEGGLCGWMWKCRPCSLLQIWMEFILLSRKTVCIVVEHAAEGGGSSSLEIHSQLACRWPLAPALPTESDIECYCRAGR